MRRIDEPEVVAEELFSIIRDSIARAPRTLQKRIGPSQLGMPCTRRLLHALLEQKTGDQASRWKAQVGTAIHADLARIFAGFNEGLAEPRFLLEQQVEIGELAGQPISGSCDLFDVDSGAVVDWKTTGPRRLLHYRRLGPGQQYRIQAHSYGRGWARAGYTVRSVLLVFLPRDGELGTSYVWHEPYDEQVCLGALSRATGLLQLVRTFGFAATSDMYAPCTDDFCPVCPTRKPYGAAPRASPATPVAHQSVDQLFATARKELT